MPPSQASISADGGDHPAVCDGTSADDIAFLVIFTSSASNDVLASLGLAASIIERAFRTRALAPNYAVGKSAIVLQMSSHGARALRHNRFIDNLARFEVADISHSVRINSSHRHLKALATCNSSVVIELGERIKQHGRATAPIRKALFKRGLPQRARCQHVDSLAMCLLIAHSGAREAFTKSQLVRLDAAQVRTYGQATGKPSNKDADNFTNAEIFKKS